MIRPPSPRAHHLVRFIYQEIDIQKLVVKQVCKSAGVNENSLRFAADGRSSLSLDSAEALLNELGFSTKPTPLKRSK